MSPQNNRRSGYFSGEVTYTVVFHVALVERWLFPIKLSFTPNEHVQSHVKEVPKFDFPNLPYSIGLRRPRVCVFLRRAWLF